MHTSKRFLFLSSLLLLAMISSAAAKLGEAPKGLIGGYEPIKNANDPYVVEIAKFAVNQHNNNNSDDLVFVKVVSGQQQVVSGVNYKLTIVATHGVHGGRGNSGKYLAVVYDRPWDKYRSLTSFEKV